MNAMFWFAASGVLALTCAALPGQQPQPVIASTPLRKPDAAVVRQIEARRETLRRLGATQLARIDPDDAGPSGQAARQLLGEFNAALCDKSPVVYAAAITDWVNGLYACLPPDRVLSVLLPHLGDTVPDAQLSEQGVFLENFGRRFRSKAIAGLPALLEVLKDDRRPAYLRGRAVAAVAHIAPGDPKVVAVFAEALDNPNPRTESGVHDEIARRLTDMGPCARPARPALERLYARGGWNRDYAFIALGRLEQDQPPLRLDDYLTRLRKVNELPTGQVAAAFLHIAAICNPTAKPPEPNFRGSIDRRRLDHTAAAAARPILLAVAEEHIADAYGLAALRNLRVIGPGATPRAARLLARNLLLQKVAEWAAVRTDTVMLLDALDPSDPEAVEPLREAFTRLIGAQHSDSRTAVVATLARFGSKARRAAPDIARALRELRPRSEGGSAAPEEFCAYADALAAVGGDEPETLRTILDLLGADGLLKASDKGGPLLQVKLLLVLAHLHLPAAGPDRPAAIRAVLDGLASDSALVFSAAAKVVVGQRKAWTREEVRSLVPLLGRVVTQPSRFKQEDGSLMDLAVRSFSWDDQRLIGGGFAIRALGALGPPARDVLPTLEALARQPLREQGSYAAEPAVNVLIREARQAVAAIR